MKKCIFAGTFDPPTLGHDDTISQALKIFDEVVIAILINPAKTPLFTLQERKQMLSLLYGNNSQLRIIEWQGAVVDLLEKENTPFYVRGLRNTVDFEYENANLYANRQLKEDIITVYLPAKQEHIHISSTLAKGCIHFDKPLEQCVAPVIADYIHQILQKRKEA
ncbi:MAG: pantetheine-phosphate adenylyltransferase [Clostridia bacterium]|nr:pantetheine-phosphate adenylyltransferase [Clostridia bacterium]